MRPMHSAVMHIPESSFVPQLRKGLQHALVMYAHPLSCRCRGMLCWATTTMVMA